MSAVKDTKIILASCPYDDSYFNKLAIEWTEANRQVIPWNLHPQRDEKWFSKMCETLNFKPNSIDQELNCIINYKEKSSKDKTISLRIPFDTLRSIKSKIGDELSISDYIRSLIDKDL
jgi:predicted DNA binding CopG/RHH family protein